MLSAMKVADFFIEIAQNGNEEFMTPLRLQKLLYFAQGWNLARHNRPLFSERIEAWNYGPVVREVYNKYAPYGRNPITQPKSQLDDLSDDDMSLLLDVFREYGRYTAAALVEKSHDTAPWREAILAGQNAEISIERMRTYFSSLPSQLASFDEDVEKMLPIVEGFINEEGVTIFPKEGSC